jgi:hypothetical protein
MHSNNYSKASRALALAGALALLLLQGCSGPADNRRAVFILIDISGDYASELQQARTLSNYMLANLNSGDSLAIAFIDNSSFTERNIIARATFDHRPSVASQQKRLFQAQVEGFLEKFRVPSHHSDITGGILLASDFLHEMEAGRKHLFILSDLHEDLPPWLDREVQANLDSIQVVAVNVKRQRRDNNNPREYQERLASWQQRVEESGGHWQLVNDMTRLERAWQ